MAPDLLTKAQRLIDAGHSPMSAARCLDGVSYRDIELHIWKPEHKPTRTPKLEAWWMQQPWCWRPDNTEPIEAPWERVTREWF